MKHLITLFYLSFITDCMYAQINEDSLKITLFGHRNSFYLNAGTTGPVISLFYERTLFPYQQIFIKGGIPGIVPWIVPQLIRKIEFPVGFLGIGKYWGMGNNKFELCFNYFSYGWFPSNDNPNGVLWGLFDLNIGYKHISKNSKRIFKINYAPWMFSNEYEPFSKSTKVYWYWYYDKPKDFYGLIGLNFSWGIAF